MQDRAGSGESIFFAQVMSMGTASSTRCCVQQACTLVEKMCTLVEKMCSDRPLSPSFLQRRRRDKLDGARCPGAISRLLDAEDPTNPGATAALPPHHAKFHHRAFRSGPKSSNGAGQEEGNGPVHGSPTAWQTIAPCAQENPAREET